MGDLGLVKRLMDGGLDRDAAHAQVDAVTAAMVAQLSAGKVVTFVGVGVIAAPEKVVRAPFPPGKLRRQRKAALRKAAVVTAGEPYDDLDYVPPKKSTYGHGGYR